MKTARQITLDLLIRMDTQGAYSNIILDHAFTSSDVDKRDKAFSAALFYGVLERRMTLDYLIRYYSGIEFDKIKTAVVEILRMGFYLLLFMNSVPDSAAVNESVELCEYCRCTRAKGYVNAILRSFLRNEKQIDYGNLKDEAKLSIEYSCPKWLIKKWKNELGEQRAMQMIHSGFGRPPMYARVNTVRYSVDDVISELAKDGITAVKNMLIENCIELSATKGIEQSVAHKKGMLHIQDISSQICCKIAAPVFNETVVDLCSAPGGKTFTCAEMMNDRGRIYSYDLYDGKVSVIANTAKRLGLTIITAAENDAAKFNPDIPKADKVICDVPCSGLGVIRRKPEIKYKPMKLLETLPDTQRKIINNAAEYVKPGGTLIYSTCTVSKAENDDIVDEFLAEHCDFVPVVIPLGVKGLEESYKRTMLPCDINGDGFFTATLRKVK